MHSPRSAPVRRRMHVLAIVTVLGGVTLAACSSTSAPAAIATAATSQPSPETTTSTGAPPTTVAVSAPPATTSIPSSTSSTSSTPPTQAPDTTVPVVAATTVPATVATTTASTTAPTTAPAAASISPPTASAGTASPAPQTSEQRTIGMSVQGRPIIAVHRGTPGGHVVLVIGVIHGDEDAGLAITAQLATTTVPDDVDLWIVDSMNPDGQAAGDRHNADQVDLNRNFPYAWAPLGHPGSAEYAGTGPASEPETQAMVAFITEVRPEMIIWYHQDLDRIAPSTGLDGMIRARYSELTGVPLLRITGGTYTGVAATWARQEFGAAVAFIVELGPTLDAAQAAVHAGAVLTVAGEL